jgi:nitrogen fixation/metabolism regulation signal transduction histidine kinase
MKLTNRLFLAFFLFAFVPVSLISLVTLELAGRGVERVTSPGIERALSRAHALADLTLADQAARASRTLLACPPRVAPADLLARGLDFALAVAEGDTATAWDRRAASATAPTGEWKAADVGLDPALRALARRTPDTIPVVSPDGAGVCLLGGRPVVCALHRRGPTLLVGGYFLSPAQWAHLTGLTDDIQSFGRLKLLSSINRRFLRLVWLAASLAYLLVILAVARLTARGLTRPLARLGDLVETVGPGRWDVRLDYSRRDEVGALVQGFNRMSVRLSETTRRLIMAEKAAAWEQTARVIAHGIKNVLAPVKLAVLRLAHSVDAADREPASALATIQAELGRLEKIAHDFALYGRPVREPDLPVDLNAVVRQAVQLCAAPGGGARIDLALVDPPPTVLADWAMLREALVNLIKNGRDAAGTEGVVAVATLHHGDDVIVTVHDTGLGIDPDLASRIFDPYVTTRPGGTGLGLAIVRKIVESSGGRIGFTTAPGDTMFSVTLPAHGTEKGIDGD